ncbi:phage tail protein [Micromonospora sp. NPDC005806]|uniref:phage tail protein n=1 Tax=Micromonospora sp. NPDC005806 TaxID=3364234 RepID=UPI00368301B5
MSVVAPGRVSPRDPLRTYQFTVSVGGSSTPTAGVRRVSGLTRAVQPYEIWEGGNSLHRYAQPDRVTWEPITLEQGLALDDTLARWATACTDFLDTGVPAPGSPVKQDVVIEASDPHSDRRLRYHVYNAWVSRFQALPQLDAMSHEVGLLLVELVHEGWKSEEAPAPPVAPPRSVGDFPTPPGDVMIA